MLKLGIFVFSTLAFSLGSFHLVRGQTNADELWSGWQLGRLRGSLILRLSSEEENSFMSFVEKFTSERVFLKFQSVGRPALSGRRFVSDWYRRSDGVTMFVTNITMPEKMQVAFYDRKDGKGAIEAEQIFLEFEGLSSMFVRYK